MPSNQLSLFQATYDEYKVTKPIRLIEFFAGYGSQSLAMKYLGLNYESWRICEWNYKSCEAYKLLHTEDDTNYSKDLTKEQLVDFIFSKGVSANWNKPMTLKQVNLMKEPELRKAYNAIIATHNLVDISRVHAEDLEIEKEASRKHCYFAFYSFPCGLAGEKVKTIDGYKNIEDIQVGYFVQTHENRYRKVAKTMTKIADGYQTIKATGAALQVTANHPLYVMRDGSLQWIHASEVRKGDYLSYNINKEEKRVELSNEELWLLGRYVADGFINKYLSYSVLFAIGFPKEDEFLSHSPKQFVGRWKKTKKDCWEYRIADKDFQSLCFQFGNGAKNKRLPQWVMDLPKDQLRQFVDGYLSGDGHIRHVGSGKQIMFCTVSKELFMGIQQCLLKLYGRICTLSIRKGGRKETFNDTYNGQLEIEFEGKSHCQFSDGNHAYGLVRSNERTDEEIQVYNMEVEEDNSYTIDNCIVHNCQDLSLAGKRKLMEKGSSTRSGLLWEFERIMLELREREERPDILVMENVPQVHGKGAKEDFDLWIQSLERMGYSNYYQDLNSDDCGVPQTRNRCFMVSILGEWSYVFPNPIPLEYFLKDLLVPKAPEKYYLSEKQMQNITLWNNTPNRMDGQEKDTAGTLTTHAGRNDYDCNYIPIKEATKKGFKEAHNGDGVYTTAIEKKRGTVQDGKIQTIKTPLDVGVVLRSERTEEGKELRKKGIAHFQVGHELKPRPDGESNTISTFEKDNLVAKKE